MHSEAGQQDNRLQILGLLRREIETRLPAKGRTATAIEGLMLTRIDARTAPEKCLYYPMIALVAQGEKRAFYGESEICYGSGEYVALATDMPGVFHIPQASGEVPFLSLSIRLDARIISALSAEYPLPDRDDNKAETEVIGKEEAGEDVLLAFYRLLRLLHSPENIPVFASAIIREIHYHILKGSLGEKLRLAITPGTRDNRIAQAIAWLRGHFRETFSMQALAQQVCMAPSTFNKCFRDATSISPLQFQKRLRLYEAQRLMLMEKLDAHSASDAVGYESAAQFSREYKRLFGETPGQNRARHLS